MLQTRLLLAWCSLYLISLCTVSGISLQITQNPVVFLSQSPPQTSFLCHGMSAQGIETIYDISLSKSDQNGNDKVIATADIVAGLAFEDTAPQSLTKPTPAKVGGGIDSTIAADSTLKVDFETNEMVCADAGMYKCSYSYRGTDKLIHSMATQTNLSVHVLPSEVTLTAQKGGMTALGSFEAPLAMNINESIQFTCNGNIGSETTNLIRWKMSSVYTTTFMQHTDNVVKGTISSSDGGCSYTSSSTMTYVVQARDADGDNYLAFFCYVTDQPPNQDQVTRESSVFYIAVIGGNSGSGGNPGDSTGGGPANAGAIAGGVIGGVVAIVIIVLLVYFLWYRRRSAGDTYRTKEDTGPDNPNIAPSTDDLYAKPAKDKNRNQLLSDNGPMYDNPDGYDRRRDPPKTTGELHYAELDIASRPPMPAARKPINEPVEYAEVKFTKSAAV